MQGRERHPLRVVARWLPQTLPELAAIGTVTAFVALPFIEAEQRECRIAARIGRPCPMCGGTTALQALRRGDVAEALRWNRLVVAVAGLGLAMAPVTVGRRLRYSSSLGAPYSAAP